jgi:hypothetical protein
VNEESQIEEMRAALRGDRERAEARRQTMENVLEIAEPAEPIAEPVAEPELPQRRSLIDRLLGR